MRQIALSLVILCLLTACTKRQSESIVRVDGSSTVFPLTEAVAETFQKNNKIRVTVGVSGTGGGFKKFCGGQIAVTGASRPITAHEIAECQKKQINFIELPVAYDGIVVAVHPQNTWVDKITPEELKVMWEPGAQAKIKKWNQIRPSWPDEEIHLFGPGVDSGTYDYFTLAIVGKEHSSRGDITSSEDDNVLVQGVSTDKLALGFFGFSYFLENRDKIKAVPINGIMPSFETISSGQYRPLSRPVFIYVAQTKDQDKAVDRFVSFYLGEGQRHIKEVGFVPLSENAFKLVNLRFKQRALGTIFGAATKTAQPLESLLAGK